MRERIIDEIRKIEDLYEVKVCFAVESGSRARGYPSLESDFDVRFIYVHRKEWYLSIDEKKDVIELPVNNKLDMSGWDVRKALRLFQKSNPSLMEWLHSGMIYYQAYSLVDKMKEMQDKVFLPQSTIYHYLNMAKRNLRDTLGREEVKIKKYLNIIRPILACNWIEQYHTVPPVDLQELLGAILPNKLIVKQEINLLLKRKMSGEEHKIEREMTIIHEYVEMEIERIQEYLKHIQVSKREEITPKLNILFRDILLEAWS